MNPSEIRHNQRQFIAQIATPFVAVQLKVALVRLHRRELIDIGADVVFALKKVQAMLDKQTLHMLILNRCPAD